MFVSIEPPTAVVLPLLQTFVNKYNSEIEFNVQVTRLEYFNPFQALPTEGLGMARLHLRLQAMHELKCEIKNMI